VVWCEIRNGPDFSMLGLDATLLWTRSQCSKIRLMRTAKNNPKHTTQNPPIQSRLPPRTIQNPPKHTTRLRQVMLQAQGFSKQIKKLHRFPKIITGSRWNYIDYMVAMLPYTYIHIYIYFIHDSPCITRATASDMKSAKQIMWPFSINPISQC